MDMIQYSDAWWSARLGKVTASRVSDVIAKTKTGWGTGRKNYMATLIAERLTGNTADSFTSPAMQFGTDNEPDARRAYEFRTDADVTEIGFVDHPTVAMSGASPDGLVGTDGLVEIKVPNTATHLDTLLGQKIPSKYVTQMQWQISCAGRAWCDFVSFDPRLPEAMRLLVRRVDRDDELIASLEKDVTAFLAELDDKLDSLRSRYMERAA